MTDSYTKYDVLVIGGGHAGVEASYAPARMGLKVALVTLSAEKIAEMSCNPAIGGLAKGHIVCEIDALGGVMGTAIDATGIQFRMLNRSKGPAVWGPRAQADKVAYRRFVRAVLENEDNIDIIEGQVVEILAEGGHVKAVRLTDGTELAAETVVVTTGTFLNGLVHIGDESFPAGRINEPAAVGLSDSLTRLGFRIGRLKTGTCPRLARDSIDYSQCQEQPGDDLPTPFSMMTDSINQPQTLCHITYTNERTHHILKASLDRAPTYTGQIQSTGPRYCPSIELKITRFPDKNRHQLFLEPESLEYDWVYVNGLTTSVPKDIQHAMVESIEGLQNAEIVQYGYAIEYDYAPPDQLYPTLQSKDIRGLYLAGQINGTSGYEEAAGQGLMAGINAGLSVQGSEPIVLARDQAYIGVLIDDLVTKGVDEPYRMFTSRAEFRLLLRHDTAERRLTPLGRRIGMIDDDRWVCCQRRIEQGDRLGGMLKKTLIGGVQANVYLKRQQAGWEALLEEIDGSQFAEFDERVINQVVNDCKYEGYQQREMRAARKLQELDRIKLPADLNYDQIPGLRNEGRERIAKQRPITLGQASRIVGVTPADIMVIMVYLQSHK